MNKIKEFFSNIKLPALPTSEKILTILKIVLYIFGAILLFVPIFLIIKYLKSQNKKITLTPHFMIVDVENTEDIDENVLGDAIKIGKAMIDKMVD